MHTFLVWSVSGALPPLRPLAGGEGGAHAERCGRVRWGRAADRSLRLPPPHPDPLRPQGRRGGYWALGCVHASTRAAESATLKLPQCSRLMNFEKAPMRGAGRADEVKCT